MHFDLNTKNARAIASRPPRITETGEYVGKIVDAYYYTTQGGAGMVRLDFEEAETGRTCAMTMCIQKKDGSDTFSRAILDALMTVFRVRFIETARATIKRGNGTMSVERFPDFIGESVGVLLQRENDPNNEDYPFRMNLVTPFDPKSRMIAAEILDKATEAKMLDMKKKGLKDRNIKAKSSPVTSAASADYVDNAPSRAASYFDDDQPF